MTQALKEARAYRDPVVEDKGFSSQQIKMAYGILNDPRYKQGNYSGAVRAIDKIAKGLSNHPDVANALKRANEELDKDDKETIKPIIKKKLLQKIYMANKTLNLWEQLLWFIILLVKRLLFLMTPMLLKIKKN